jgi:hypothetical protein
MKIKVKSDGFIPWPAHVTVNEQGQKILIFSLAPFVHYDVISPTFAAIIHPRIN